MYKLCKAHFILLVFLSAGFIAGGCGGTDLADDAPAQVDVDSGNGSDVGGSGEAATDDNFNLMDYSSLEETSGVYVGYFEEVVSEKVTVQVGVEVTLEDGKITALELADTSWVHPAAARLIPQRILESQRLPVDIVSGASVASWSIILATSQALEIDISELDDFSREGIINK